MEYIPTLSYAPYPSDMEARETAIKELERENKNQTEDNIKERILSLRFDISFHILAEEILPHRAQRPNSQEELQRIKILILDCFLNGQN